MRLVGVLRAFERKAPSDFEWCGQRPAYPGLRSFRPDEAGVFFGRDADAGRIIERFSAALVKREPHLITLTGPTGSGISSLMLAGVLPGIERNQTSVISLPAMRPRLRPLDALAVCLATALDRFEQWRAWADELTKADAGALVAFLEARIQELRAHFNAPDADILLPVDQFEELYHVSGAAQAQIFQGLLAALMAQDLPMFVIAALSSDDAKTFLDSRLAALRFEAITVEPIPTTRYGELIRGPAERAGLQIDDGLVRSIRRHATLAASDPLTRVAYVLRQMFDSDRQTGRLSESSYLSHADSAAGRSPLEAAVARAADGAIERAEDHTEERRAVRQALMQSLVRWDARSQPIRRPASLEAFPREALEVIDQLAAAGLLTKTQIGDEHLVEFATPAVFRLWPWLEQALRAERSGPETIASSCRELARYDPPPGIAVRRWHRAGRLARNSIVGVLCVGAVMILASARLGGPNAERPVAPARTVIAHGSGGPSAIAEPEAPQAQPNPGRKTTQGYRPLRVSVWMTPTAFGRRRHGQTRQKADPEISPTQRSVPTPVALSMTPTAWGRLHMPPQPAQRPQKSNAGLSPKQHAASHPTPVALSMTPTAWGDGGPAVPAQPKAADGKVAAIASLGKLLGLTQLREPSADGSRRLLLTLEALLHPDAWKLSSSQILDLKRSILADIYARSRPISFRTHRDTVFSAALSPEGRTVVTASADRTARLWNLGTRTELHTLAGHRGYVHSAAFSPDGSHVATTSGDGTARVWRAGTDAKAVVLRGHRGAVHRAAFDPTGTRIVTASADGTAGVWDARTGKRLKTLGGHRGAVWNAAFSADGKLIVTGAKDKTARVWRSETGELLVTLKGHRSDVMSAAFSPDGARVATASRDSTIRLWDATSGSELAVLQGHKDTVISALFSEVDGYLVSASFDGTVKIWDLAAGQALSTFRFEGQRVRSAQFASDGRSVLAATSDGTIFVRPVFSTTSDLVAGALKAAGHCLGPPERRTLGLPADQPSWCKWLDANKSDDPGLRR
ncbi:MAG: hypothetical protein ACR2PO_03610 [Methyloligellaceae bacterium]